MLRGELYLADDPELAADHARAQALSGAATTRPARGTRRSVGRLLRSSRGASGTAVVVKPSVPLRLRPAHRGAASRSFVNTSCVMLRRRAHRYRAACQIATRAQLLTAAHPIDPAPRRDGLGRREGRSRSATTSGSAAGRSCARASRSARTRSWAPARWSRVTCPPTSSPWGSRDGRAQLRRRVAANPPRLRARTTTAHVDLHRAADRFRRPEPAMMHLWRCRSPQTASSSCASPAVIAVRSR